MRGLLILRLYVLSSGSSGLAPLRVLDRSGSLSEPSLSDSVGADTSVCAETLLILLEASKHQKIFRMINYHPIDQITINQIQQYYIQNYIIFFYDFNMVFTILGIQYQLN